MLTKLPTLAKRWALEWVIRGAAMWLYNSKSFTIQNGAAWSIRTFAVRNQRCGVRETIQMVSLTVKA